MSSVHARPHNHPVNCSCQRCSLAPRRERVGSVGVKSARKLLPVAPGPPGGRRVPQASPRRRHSPSISGGAAPSHGLAAKPPPPQGRKPVPPTKPKLHRPGNGLRKGASPRKGVSPRKGMSPHRLKVPKVPSVVAPKPPAHSMLSPRYANKLPVPPSNSRLDTIGTPGVRRRRRAPAPPSQPSPSSSPSSCGLTREMCVKRHNIAKEVLQTERDYMEAITKLVTVYKPAFASKYESKVLELFCNVDEIINGNTAFMADLNDCVTNWHDDSTLGDVFIKHASKFEVYTEYIRNHHQAIMTLDSLEKRKEFTQWMKGVEDVSGAKSMPNLLIMPVQRLPRYEMLLRELLSKSEGHADAPLLEEAIVAVTTITEKVDELIKREENLHNSYRIQKKLGMKDLITDEREYVMEGTIWKVCRKVPKRRWFVLFNDILIYATINPGNVMTNAKMYDLTRTVIKDMLDCSEQQNAFQVLSLGKSFVVYTDTEEEKLVWIHALKRHAKGSDAEHAAVWVPDSHQKNCTICADKFTFVLRRHHCRKCGALVCGACSKYRIIVPSVNKYQPVRVCVNCDEEHRMELCARQRGPVEPDVPTAPLNNNGDDDTQHA